MGHSPCILSFMATSLLARCDTCMLLILLQRQPTAICPQTCWLLNRKGDLLSSRTVACGLWGRSTDSCTPGLSGQ